MAYTTQPDLDAAAGGAVRFTQLADWDNNGVADPAIVARAQAAADGFIDSHLRKFSAGDLAALRAAPTETIKRLAADEAVFWLREKGPIGVSENDLKMRDQRIEELKMIKADELRVSDTKTARARFIDNEDPVSRKGSKGMW